MTDEQMCEEVAGLLMGVGIVATAEDTGGNTWVVEVPEPLRTDTKWRLGMATDQWGGYLFTGLQIEDDDPYVSTDVSSETTDPVLVAHALAAGLDKWRSRERRDADRASDKAALERSRRRHAVRRDGTMEASTALLVYAVCPYCEFSGEVKLEDGWYDNQWDGGRGGFRVTCPSCDKPFVIEQPHANDIQHVALVMLGEAEVTR